MSGDYDPRAIANLILDEAERRGMQISNLALQKLLYFAHGAWLTKTGRPLVSGYFEAWQFGPVHPAVYRAFKPAGANPISMRASGADPLTGAPRPLTMPNDLNVIDLVTDVVKSYGRLPPGRIVDLSRAERGPWRAVVDKADDGASFGMRIPNDLIAERFKHHKVSVGQKPRAEEPPNEDAPFA